MQGTVEDQVTAWQWQAGNAPSASVTAPEISPRDGFRAGVDLAPAAPPSGVRYQTQAMSDIHALGANSLTLTPTWTLTSNNPLPLMGFDPANGAFDDDLLAAAAEARRQGLAVAVRPSLVPDSGGLDAWWVNAPRDSAWWSVWFESYRSFILSYARLAQAMQADSLVLGGPEAAPALPGGRLPGGNASSAPGDAEACWRALIDDVRGLYSGRVVFEIEDGTELQVPPPFLDAVDAVRVYWHVPLGQGKDLDLPSMQTAAGAALDQLIQTPGLAGKPIELSVEYLSIDGGATACAPRADGSCRPASDFVGGADADPDLGIDLGEQALAYNALLLEATQRPVIQGFYARGYNPIVALQDKSASVRGKPARDMIWYWYQRLTGQPGSS